MRCYHLFCAAESVFLPYEILSIARLIVMNAAAFNATLKLAASQLSITEENTDTEEVKAQKALLNCGREHAESAWVTACSLMEKILELCQSGLSSVKSTSITLNDELDALVLYFACLPRIGLMSLAWPLYFLGTS